MTIIFSDIVFCQAAFFIARNYGRVPVRNLVGPKAMQKIESFNQNQLEENFFLMTGLLMTGLFDFSKLRNWYWRNSLENIYSCIINKSSNQ